MCGPVGPTPNGLPTSPPAGNTAVAMRTARLIRTDCFDWSFVFVMVNTMEYTINTIITLMIMYSLA